MSVPCASQLIVEEGKLVSIRIFQFPSPVSLKPFYLFFFSLLPLFVAGQFCVPFSASLGCLDTIVERV